jgi:protein-disulfide isomerase
MEVDVKNGQVVMILAAAGVLGLVVGKLSTPSRPKPDELAVPSVTTRSSRPATVPQPMPEKREPAARAEQPQAPAASPPQAQPRPPKPSPNERKQVAVAADDATMGPANAKVTIVEFSDFQCPFCSKVEPTLKQIRDAYPDSVRIVFKHNPLPFHKDANLAAQAAVEATKQGRFWEFHDKLFQNNKSLKREDLERHAQDLGLDLQRFRAALDTSAHTAQVQRDMSEAQSLGATGTPAFFVNGRFVSGAQPFERFKTLIDEEIGR